MSVALYCFFFAEQKRSACLFSLLLSILEVQWDPASLVVLASLGHLVLLSLQWGHQDPMNQERFAAFCKTSLQVLQISLPEMSRALCAPRIQCKTQTAFRTTGKGKALLVLKPDHNVPETSSCHRGCAIPQSGNEGLLSCLQFLLVVMQFAGGHARSHSNSQLLLLQELYPNNPAEKQKLSAYKPSLLVLGCRSCDRLKPGDGALCPSCLEAPSYPMALPIT